MKRLFVTMLKKFFAITLTLLLIITSVGPLLQATGFIQKAEAAQATCTPFSSTPVGSGLKAVVGGVALDQAATFLAEMDDISGAYYDETLDRIVFVGKKNTTLPEFDKDDLAVAIKSIVFDRILPGFSFEIDPADPSGPNLKAQYYGPVENTRFGKVMAEADYMLKKYTNGYDENQQPITSSVPGYKSAMNRYIEHPEANPQDYPSSTWERFWLSPLVMTLKKDDTANAFVFEQAKMQVRTEVVGEQGDPTQHEAAVAFANHFTQNYDFFAQEAPIYQDLKQLGKIVSVVKWMKDTQIVTDFNWAREYEPKRVTTPKSMPKITTPVVPAPWGTYQIIGGADYYTPNTYSNDTGSATALKAASQAVATTKEDIHWTFTKDGQQYESVAVAADAFRSLGSYSTTVTDMSFPAIGDFDLAFSRTYSSFSGGQQGIGRGWSIFPAKLYDNKAGWTITCNGQTYPWKLAVSTPSGLHETFTYTCENGYVVDDPAYHSKITRDTNGIFTVLLKDQTHMFFFPNYKLGVLLDRNGNSISYGYNSAGKLIGIKDKKNHQLTLNYSTVNGQSLITSLQDWTGRNVQYSYDEQGNLLTVKDPRGNLTSYTYDTNNKLIKITDREGQQIITNTYTPEAKLATQTDAGNNTKSFTYNDTNRIISIADNATPSRTASVKYDEKARILEDIDAYNNKFIYTYGTEYAPLSIKDKSNNLTTFTYDSRGNMESVIYPDLKKVSYQYNTQNRVTKITDERHAPAKITDLFYYAEGNLEGQPKDNLWSIKEGEKQTLFTYHPDGQLYAMWDPLNQRTFWTYDDFGNKKEQTNANSTKEYFYSNSLGQIYWHTDATNKHTAFAYDENDNLTGRWDAKNTSDEAFTWFQYDKENRLKKTILPTNTETDYSYNAAGSLASVTDASDNTTSYGYDRYQNLTSRLDALNRTTLFEYDLMNRQKKSTTPLGAVREWSYDAAGNIEKRIDEQNRETKYAYDPFHRLKEITYPDTSKVTYTYDNRGNILTVTSSIGVTRYEYDEFDRLKKVTNPYNQAVAYTYDKGDNLKTITYPGGKVVKYDYDNVNRLTTVTDWNTTLTRYEYYDNNFLKKKILPNGIESLYSYDAVNRISEISHTKAGVVLAKFSYERDKIGKIKKVTEEGSFLGTLTPTPTPTPTLGPTTPTPTFTPTPTPTSGVTITSTPTNTPTPTPTSGTGSQPDLIVTNVTIDPASPQADDSFDINVTIKNQSNISTGTTFRVGYYYDRPSAPAPDTYDDTDTIFGGVGANAEKTSGQGASFETAGAHNIWVIVDRENNIAEGNEANNVFGPYQVNVVASSGNTSLFEQLASFFSNAFRPVYAQTATQITTFTYDLLGRVIDATYPTGERYEYTFDKRDNRLTQKIGETTTNYTYDADDKLTSLGQLPYTYTLMGNLMTNNTGQFVFSYVYDFENRLTSLTKATAPNQNESAYTLSTADMGGIDVGIDSAPAFVDIDNDGDLDMFVGEDVGNINLYTNTGSNTNPSWTLTAASYNNIDIGSDSSPAFVDIDNDGDKDMFIGENDGTINYYQNTGNATTPQFGTGISSYQSIDAGSYSSPTFIDIDTDGDQDMAIGESGGAVKLYKNIGSQTSPAFTADTLFQGIDVGSFSAPSFVDFDKDSDFDLFIGEQNGNTNFYRNTGSVSSPAFTLVTEDFSGIDVGYDSSPVFADIDNDGDKDFFVGEDSGNINYYTAAPAQPGSPATTSYTYDAEGNRIQKISGGTTTRYVNGISGLLSNVLVETNGSNSIQKYFLYGKAMISQGSSGTSSRMYPLTDAMGNLRFLTDASGAKTRSYDYDPFGNIRATTGTTANSYQFNVQQVDSESGLYYLRARYYDPVTGRFTSRDPIKGKLMIPQTQNPYVYSLNNPIMYADPSGLEYVDISASSGIIGPLGAGVGVQVNEQGWTPYVAGGVVTPGKGVTVTASGADPQENTDTVNIAANYIVAGSVSYPANNEVVPITEGEVAVGVGYPAGASMTINHTFGTYCWN